VRNERDLPNSREKGKDGKRAPQKKLDRMIQDASGKKNANLLRQWQSADKPHLCPQWARKKTGVLLHRAARGDGMTEAERNAKRKAGTEGFFKTKTKVE